jgi:hypothetical protein
LTSFDPILGGSAAFVTRCLGVRRTCFRTCPGTCLTILFGNRLVAALSVVAAEIAVVDGIAVCRSGLPIGFVAAVRSVPFVHYILVDGFRS